MSMITGGIFIGIALFIIVMVPTFIFAIMPRVTKQFNVKTNFMIAGGYLALLILLSLVCTVLPRGTLVKAVDRTQTVDNGGNTDIIDKRVTDGDFGAPDGYKKIKQSFVPNGSSLTVMSENFGVNIINKTKGVDTVDNGDGKIDVYCYMAEHSYFNGTDLGINAGVPTIEYSGNKITVKRKRQPTLNVCEFRDGLAARQFFNTDMDLSFVSSASNNNSLVVVLPRGVEVTESGNGVG